MQQAVIIMFEAFRRYRDQWQGESEVVTQFESFLHGQVDAFARSNLTGHFTGSAWLVSADGTRVLLMHHRKLDRWLQPGGHADGDVNLARVALREAEEETGLTALRVDRHIFDLDLHRIAARPIGARNVMQAAPSGVASGERHPARGYEPEHWHYDVRYVVRAGASESFVANAESYALTWRSVAEVAVDESLDISLRRMANKWLSRSLSARL
ncbi:MAG: NUDIX hydrolase [Rhodanobacter sp.]